MSSIEPNAAASKTGAPSVENTGPLHGLRVIDLASLFAGPVISTILGDFGADVVKVEHPNGDEQRYLGWQKDGKSLWWKFLSRNKRSLTLDLHKPEAQEIVRELAAGADVLIENFRPGTLERWGIGYEDLKRVNPRLVMVRVTAFGQDGPYSSRPGFGTLAEAMSGYAHINGHPDGPPTLPPFALGDAVAGLFGTLSTMFALWNREKHLGATGQCIDLSIYEPLFWILGPQALLYDQLGVVQQRTGNRTTFTSPRNIYKTRDGRWLALSASAHSIAERVAQMIERPDYLDKPWFASHVGRLEHQDDVDAAIGAWIGARDTDEVLEIAEKFQVALAPIYSIEDIFADPQYLARGTVATVADRDLGQIKMQNVIPRLSDTPGRIRWTGPEIGEHNEEILCRELGHTAAQLCEWSEKGVIAMPGGRKSRS